MKHYRHLPLNDDTTETIEAHFADVHEWINERLADQKIDPIVPRNQSSDATNEQQDKEGKNKEDENISNHQEEEAENEVSSTKAIQETKSRLEAPLGGVLVHCLKGRSRSAAFCVAFLMQRCGLELDAALERLLDARPTAAINDGFMQKLRLLEAELFPEVVEARKAAQLAQAEEEKRAAGMKFFNFVLIFKCCFEFFKFICDF